MYDATAPPISSTPPPHHAATLLQAMDRQDDDEEVQYVRGVNWAPDSTDEDEDPMADSEVQFVMDTSPSISWSNFSVEFSSTVSFC